MQWEYFNYYVIIKILQWEILKEYDDVDSFTSGTIYKAFKIKTDK